MSSSFSITENASIVISGEAGQGIDTVENFLTKIFKNSGFNTFSTREFMSRIRGGCNSTEIRLSSKPVSSFVNRIDILIALSQNALTHLQHRVTKNTLIFSEKENFEKADISGLNTIEIPLSELSKEVGGKIYSNTISAGLVLGLFSVDFKLIEEEIRKLFSKKTEDVVNNNIKAAQIGYELGQKHLKENNLTVNIPVNPELKENLLISGTDAVSMGCIAGGCNFISSYPMSPGTGVLGFLAKQADEFGIIVEQAEDEIAAINMSIGAWYAGARGMVTTSGGGFALMTEGVSLSGMLETPVVVHLAQRPGPATGLPTRTEQGDLDLALYAGHGEFPRIIFVPGTPQEAFDLSQKAFNLADKYQVPVFILTDQYLLDSVYSIKALGIDKTEVCNYFIKTEKDYKRYELTENNISPRGIPGYGEGLVVVDSDEHDEEGHITESMQVRNQMVEKRLKKMDLIKEEVELPELIGSESYKILVISWGSTKKAVEEAIGNINSEEISQLHFKQVYPVHKEIKEHLKKAETTVIVENNATSQFGKLIKLTTGEEIQHKILKYSGLPFSVEEIVKELKEICHGCKQLQY